MITFFSFFLHCTLLVICLSSSDLSHFFVLQEKDLFTECGLASDSTHIFSGDTIFSSVGIDDQALYDIILTGWFLLKGERSNDYLLFSILDNSNNIFSLFYNTKEKKFSYQFFYYSYSAYEYTNIKINIWYFIQARLTFNGSQLELYLQIFLNSVNILNEQEASPIGAGFPSYFSRKTMSVSYGYNPRTMQQPSCTIIRYFIMYLSQQTMDDIKESTYTRLSAVDTYLLWNYDYFQRTSMNTQILSTTNTDGTFTPLTLFDDHIIEFPSGYVLNIGRLDELEQTGFIIRFSFILKEGTLTNNVMILTILNSSVQNVIQLYLNSANSHLILNTLPSFSTDSGLTIVIDKLYQIVLIANLFDIKKVQLIVNYDSIFVELSNPLQSTNYSGLEFQFGMQTNAQKFTIDQVRVYRGTFVTQTEECFLTTARKEWHCLLCRPGYTLVMEIGSQCFSDSPDYNSPDFYNWMKRDCPFSTDGTPIGACMNTYYQQSSPCEAVSGYCNECKAQTFCQYHKDNREIFSGICKPGYFDDGFLCISEANSIPHRKNLVKFLPLIGAAQLESAYQVTSSDISWDSTSKSLFIGFSLMPSQSGSTSQLVGYIREKNKADFIQIVLNAFNDDTSNTVCFVPYKDTLGCYEWNSSLIWIGLWTDFISTTVTFVGYTGQIIKVKHQTNFQFIQDLVICVGFCTSFAEQGYQNYQGTLASKPITILKDIIYSDEYAQRFFGLNRQTSVKIISLSSTNATINSSTVFLNNIITSVPSTLNMKLQINSGKISPLKGVFINPGFFGFLTPITLAGEISISLNIYIETVTQVSKFFGYYMGNIVVDYNFVQHRFSDQVAISICVNLLCKTTKYSVLTKNTPQFLAIIMRDLDEQSTQLHYLELEVVCNFRREKLLFHFDYINPIGAKINTQAVNRDISYYFNNLNIYTNYDFYFDYTSTDGCFIYYNLANMICIKPKEGYALYRDSTKTEQVIVIDKDNCSSYSTETKATIYNPYTMECLTLNLIIQGCKQYSDDLSHCLQCFDENAPSNDCTTCNLGFYKEAANSECKACHSKCLTCTSAYDNCTSCKNEHTQTPDCHCVQSSQYLDASFQCQNCSPSCESCTTQADNCTVCSEGRISPPNCSCDPQYYDLTLSTISICVPIICSYKCDTCLMSSTNCSTCAYGRDNPPNCPCADGTYESSQICETCGDHKFLLAGNSICSECNVSCKQCSGISTTCTECYDSLFLVDSTCLCSDMSSFAFSTSGKILCSQYMEVSINVELNSSTYSLVFIFDSPLSEIDFSLKPIDSLILIYISQIPSENYSITNSFINGNTLTLTLEFLSSFSVQFGYATFLLNQPFMSSSGDLILNQKYLTTPLNFKIGPLIIASNEWASTKSLEVMSSAIKNTNPYVLSFIRQFQIVFYVLNTLQPCVIFLMVKITLPPNLYQFLQFVGLLIFPDVPDYSVVIDKKDHEILGIKLEKNIDYSENSSEVFRRFTFCNALLANNLIAALTTLTWPLLMLFTQIFQQVAITNKTILYASKATIFCLQKIHDNCEVALLLVTTAAFNQFLNINQSQYLTRISLYSAVAIIIILLLQNISNYLNLGEDAIKDNGGFSAQNPYLALVEKLDFQRRPSIIRKYYFLQQARKYFLAAMIVFFETYPAAVCALSAVMYVSSMVYSLWLMPYKSRWGNISKIGGEASLACSWMLFLFKFVPFQRFFQKETLIDKDEVASFINCGNVMIVILIVFNLLYLCDFLWLQVACKVIDFIKVRQAKQKAEKEQKLKEKAKKAAEATAEHEIVFYNKEDFTEGIQPEYEQDKESVFYSKQDFIDKIKKLKDSFYSSNQSVSSVHSYKS